MTCDDDGDDGDDVVYNKLYSVQQIHSDLYN